MDTETRDLMELVKSGLAAAEAAAVIQAKRLLANGHVNGHSEPTTQLALVTPPPSRREVVVVENDASKSVKDIVDELVAEDDVTTAPAGTTWQIPLLRITSARKNSKTGDKFRTPDQARSAVGGVFRNRGQNQVIGVSLKGSMIVVERVE